MLNQDHKSEPLFRIAEKCAIVYIDNRWCVTVAQGFRKIEGLRTLVHLLQIFKEPINYQEAKKAISKIVLTDADGIISTLMEMGIIVLANTEASKLCSENHLTIYPEIQETLSFWKKRCRTSSLDYSSSRIHEFDEDLMKVYAEDTQPPSPYMQFHGEVKVLLPHPSTSSPSSPLSKLSHLLFWSFGILFETDFYGFIPALAKPVPSHGARHPFEVFLVINCDTLPQGTFHYDPCSHKLVLLPICLKLNSHSSDINIFICSLFEREQWRYRHSQYYSELLLDIGHITSNIRHTARAFGLNINIDTTISPDAIGSLFHPLVLECVSLINVLVD